MRHSDLIDPADLHFSKFKTFSGSAALVTPDFANQLIAATDSNKVYRATGTTQGALVELSPSTGGNGTNSGNNSAIVSTFSGSPFSLVPDFVNQLFAAVDTNKIYRATGTTQGALVELSPTVNTQQALVQGSNYPRIFPEFIGQKYFDQTTGVLFFAKGLGVQDWRPVYEDMQVEIGISDSDGIARGCDLYYSAEEPTDGFNFTLKVFQGLYDSRNFGTTVIQTYGVGFYAIALSIPDPAIIARCAARSITQDLGGRQIFGQMTIQGSITAGGQPIGSDILVFYEFPKSGLAGGQLYSLNFQTTFI